MEQSSANENMISGNNETIETCMNDVVFKNGYKVNPSVQIEMNKNAKKGSEKIMKENLKKLHAQKQIWKPHGRTSLCWKFL
jgi:myosin-crossreactive antigen